MEIKKMPLVDDLAQSIQAVKDHLPVQTAKDLTGMVERSAKLRKLSKIGFAAMGISALISLILSGLAHYFAPSAGIAEFDVPRILIESISSSKQIGSATLSGLFSSSSEMGPAVVGESFSNVNGVLAEFLDGPIINSLLLFGLIGGLVIAVVRQTLTPIIMVVMLGAATKVVGPALYILSPEPVHTRLEQSIPVKSPREQFEIAIRDQDTASMRAMLPENSQAATYLKAQMAIKEEKLASSVIGEAAKAIALGDLGFAPNKQIAYAIEHSAGEKQLSVFAKSYADPAIAKSDLFTSLSHWVGIVTFMFGLPGIAVLLLHVSIQRRIRRIGRLSSVLLG